MRATRSKLALLAGLGALSVVLAPSALAGPITNHRIDDAFNGSAVNPSIWFPVNNDPADVSISEGGGVVSISASASAIDGFLVGVSTNCYAQGDFDERASFSLPVWPLADGVAAAINATPGDAVGRGSFFDGNVYWSFLNPQNVVVPTTDRHGSVRIVRKGSSMTSYYRAEGHWIKLDTNPSAPTDNARMTLFLASGTPFGGQPIQVNFDSFHVYAHHIRC